MLLLMMEWHWSGWTLFKPKSGGIRFHGIKVVRCKLGALPKFGSNFYYDFEVAEKRTWTALINVSCGGNHKVFDRIRLKRFLMQGYHSNTRDSGWIFKFLLI